MRGGGGRDLYVRSNYTYGLIKAIKPLLPFNPTIVHTIWPGQQVCVGGKKDPIGTPYDALPKILN